MAEAVRWGQAAGVGTGGVAGTGGRDICQGVQAWGGSSGRGTGARKDASVCMQGGQVAGGK